MTKILLFVILLVGLAVVGPLLVIWALNTLFPTLLIPYTFETWSAVVLLHAFLNLAVRVKK